jgi:hypothetical protein
MREWLNQNPLMATGLAVLVLAACVAVVVSFGGGGRKPPMGDRVVYWWDLEANAPFTASTANKAPIPAPSGGQGVIAHLFTCGKCTPDEWFGYVETYADEYHEAVRTGALADMDYSERMEFETYAVLIRSLEGGDWVPKEGVQGQAIDAEVQSRCRPQPASYCRP